MQHSLTNSETQAHKDPMHPWHTAHFAWHHVSVRKYRSYLGGRLTGVCMTQAQLSGLRNGSRLRQLCLFYMRSQTKNTESGSREKPTSKRNISSAGSTTNRHPRVGSPEDTWYQPAHHDMEDPHRGKNTGGQKWGPESGTQNGAPSRKK